MKLGISGYRGGLTKIQLEKLKEFAINNDITELHHGDCIGVDEQVHDFFRENYKDVKIIIHPPNNNAVRANKKGEEYRPEKYYTIRNKDIVNESDFLLAFPGENSRGTWQTINYAKEIKKNLLIINYK